MFELPMSKFVLLLIFDENVYLLYISFLTWILKIVPELKQESKLQRAESISSGTKIHRVHEAQVTLARITSDTFFSSWLPKFSIKRFEGFSCIPWVYSVEGGGEAQGRERENFKRVDFIHIRLQPRARSLEKVLLGYSSAHWLYKQNILSDKFK